MDDLIVGDIVRVAGIPVAVTGRPPLYGVVFGKHEDKHLVDHGCVGGSQSGIYEADQLERIHVYQLSSLPKERIMDLLACVQAALHNIGRMSA